MCLSPAERSLLFRAAVTVFAVRLGLWIMPLPAMRRRLHARGAISASLQLFPATRVAWAVQATARRIPAASCLTQALALQALLERAGKPSQVHIGTAKDPARGFSSHAWVECSGEIVLGDDGELDRYRPILALHSQES